MEYMIDLEALNFIPTPEKPVINIGSIQIEKKIIDKVKECKAEEMKQKYKYDYPKEYTYITFPNPDSFLFFQCTGNNNNFSKLSFIKIFQGFICLENLGIRPIKLCSYQNFSNGKIKQGGKFTLLVNIFYYCLLFLLCKGKKKAGFRYKR